MEERRNISLVDYSAKGVVVVCDTGEKYMVETKNVSPLGMGVIMPPETPEIVGKDIIIVASTLIMYADVNRQEKNEDEHSRSASTPDSLRRKFCSICSTTSPFDRAGHLYFAGRNIRK